MKEKYLERKIITELHEMPVYEFPMDLSNSIIKTIEWKEKKELVWLWVFYSVGVGLSLILGFILLSIFGGPAITESISTIATWTCFILVALGLVQILDKVLLKRKLIMVN